MKVEDIPALNEEAYKFMKKYFGERLIGLNTNWDFFLDQGTLTMNFKLKEETSEQTNREVFTY